MTTHYANATIPNFTMTKLHKLPPLPDENISLSSISPGDSVPVDHPGFSSGQRWARYDLTWNPGEWISNNLAVKFRLIGEDSNKWSKWSKNYKVPIIQWYELFYREVPVGPGDDDLWRLVKVVPGPEILSFDFSYSGSATVYLAIAAGLSPDQKINVDHDSLDDGGDPTRYPNNHTLFELGPLAVTA